MAEPEYTVEMVNGKPVYTKVEKEEAPPLKTVTGSKKSLQCRGRYNAYVKKRAAAGGTYIDFDKWAQINC